MVSADSRQLKGTGTAVMGYRAGHAVDRTQKLQRSDSGSARRCEIKIYIGRGRGVSLKSELVSIGKEIEICTVAEPRCDNICRREHFNQSYVVGLIIVDPKLISRRIVTQQELRRAGRAGAVDHNLADGANAIRAEPESAAIGVKFKVGAGADLGRNKGRCRGEQFHKRYIGGFIILKTYLWGSGIAGNRHGGSPEYGTGIDLQRRDRSAVADDDILGIGQQITRSIIKIWQRVNNGGCRPCNATHRIPIRRCR